MTRYVCPDQINDCKSKKRNETLKYDNVFSINPLQPGFAFLHSLKTSENLKVFRKPKSFLIFSGGIEKQHQAVMG